GDDGVAAEPDAAPATAGGNELTCVIPIELRIRIGAPGAVATPVAALVGAGTTTPAVGVRTGLGIAANEKIEIDPNYSNRRGYSVSFLGTSTRVPLPTLSAGLLQDVARLKSPGSGSDGITLRYHHYSVVVNGARRMAFFTAVNIDGRKIVQFDKREGDKWTIDPRIEETEQTGEDLYADNELDRGHLVRRLDPGWGSSFAIGKRAVDDTFHFTNCAPQHSGFQRRGKVWQGLENYILDNADNADLKVSVFTGPRFRDQDRRYRGYRIPREYWKVVVMRRKNGQLHATAYLLSQSSQIADLPEEEFIFGAYRTFQKSIASIEQATGLDFGPLRQHDPLHSDSPEEAAAAVELNSLDDIVM
ncbi:MAG: DNA/RNA non-specific endonuclease, partial [Dongiaceae bacterium]